MHFIHFHRTKMFKVFKILQKKQKSLTFKPLFEYDIVKRTFERRR
jgi:hypothetical protein